MVTSREMDLILPALKLMSKGSNGVMYLMTPVAIAVDVLAILLLVVCTICLKGLENGFSPTLVPTPTPISLKNKHHLSLKSLVISAMWIYQMVTLVLVPF